MRRIRDEVMLVQVPVMNPDGLDRVVSWYRAQPGNALRGRADGRAVPQVRRPRQQPRLVHVPHAGVEERGAAALRGVVPADRLQPPPDGAVPRAHLRAALRRPDEPQHPAAGDARHPHRGRRDHARAWSGRARTARSAGSRFDTWWNGGMRTAPYFHNMVGILTETALWRYATPVPVRRGQAAQALPRRLSTDAADHVLPDARGRAAGGACATPSTTCSTASLATLDVRPEERGATGSTACTRWAARRSRRAAAASRTRT